MEDFKNFDYKKDGLSFKNETNLNILKIFKSCNTKKISSLINWLNKNQSEFLLARRSFIFIGLCSNGHFNIAENLLSSKIFYLDSRLLNSMSFSLALSFDNNLFDYYIKKLDCCDEKLKFDSIKEFWKDFFSFQFQTDEDVINNIGVIHHVLEKIPFYEGAIGGLKNGYLIKARKKFFSNEINNLKEENRELIINKLSIACGQFYPTFEEEFKEEFEQFQHALKTFKSSSLNHKLNNCLSINLTPEKRIKT